MSGSIPWLFDPYYYRQFAPGPGDAAALWEHYQRYGWQQRLSPSPYLSVRWYLEAYPDVQAAGFDPLMHFLTAGRREFRDPHPAIRTQWYHEQHANDPSYRGDPLLHYATIGWKQGARPHPLFWTDWYAKTYLAADQAKVDPLYHFLTEGWRDGNQPNPLFSCQWYQQWVQTVRPLSMDPLGDYIRGGFAQFDPHPLFDSAYFRANRGENHGWPQASELEIYFSEYQHVSPYPLFDQAFFLDKIAERDGPDAAAALPAMVRYLQQPAGDAIDPHPFFSRKYYLAHAPDVVASGVDPLQHFVIQGWREDRPFHPLFDSAHYKEVCEESQGKNPLLHYLFHGQHARHAPRAPKVPDETTRPLPGGRRVLEVPALTPIAPRPAAAAAVRRDIGIFIHVYYIDVAAELIAYANNAPAGRTTLFISTDAPTKAREIEEICARTAKHPFEIRVVPNRGRDIAPMLVGFRDRLRETSFGLHIHSKKSLHYGRDFDSWRSYLLEQLLGSQTLAQNILTLLADEQVGVVAPDHYGPIKGLIQWGGNFDLVAGMLTLVGETLTPEHVLDFPSGSMFWFRTAALAKLFELNLRTYHFEPEAAQVDGTLAHAIERSVFYFVEAAGYRCVIARAAEALPAPAVLADMRQGRASRLASRIFPTHRELGVERVHHPECTRFVATASLIARPRINLLVPFVDPGQAYAGVATALEIFSALRQELGDGFDARLLATDSAPGKQYAPPAGYDITPFCGADSEGRDTIEDASQRHRYPVMLRDHDILMATAWWTARHALDCLTQQDRLFAARPRRMIYLIQDFEPGFYPQSTKYALAANSYRDHARTIPLFNTELLATFFRSQGLYQDGLVLNPGIARGFLDRIARGAAKERIVLLYARPHAERNCLSFLDMLVAQLHADDPVFWRGWRFCAVGEEFSPRLLRCTDRIELLGRLKLGAYAQLASRAALGISLMVAPHPSYPPLEMAEAGMLVLTNTHGARNLAAVHENIHAFTGFDVAAVAAQFKEMAQTWAAAPLQGWRGRPKIDWFFGGRSNLPQVSAALAEEVRRLVAPATAVVEVARSGPARRARGQAR